MLKKVILAIVCVCGALSAVAADLPKREFRGAWLHTVYQDQYLRNTTGQNKAYLRKQLDSLRTAGVNAVIFQVRPRPTRSTPARLSPGAAT